VVLLDQGNGDGVVGAAGDQQQRGARAVAQVDLDLGDASPFMGEGSRRSASTSASMPGQAGARTV